MAPTTAEQRYDPGRARTNSSATATETMTSMLGAKLRQGLETYFVSLSSFKHASLTFASGVLGIRQSTLNGRELYVCMEV